MYIFKIISYNSNKKYEKFHVKGVSPLNNKVYWKEVNAKLKYNIRGKLYEKVSNVFSNNNVICDYCSGKCTSRRIL